MRNGLIRGFDAVKRDRVLTIDPSLYPSIEGSTDTELMFYMALSLGLKDEPIPAVEHMAGLIEAIADRQGIENSIQMTLATTNGESLWVFRYSTEQCSRSLFYSADVCALQDLCPDNPRLAGLSEETRLVVSEPLSSLPGAWKEVAETGSVNLVRLVVQMYIAINFGLSLVTRIPTISEPLRVSGNPFNEFIVNRTPAGRWGDPADLQGTAVFLASAASDFINGQIIYVDGGILATIGKPANE